MKRTPVVVAFFVAAFLVGLYVVYGMQQTTESFSVAQSIGMPTDMQATGVYAASPLLGSEPKTLSDKPYDMTNDEELFMFKNNRISTDCCPSAFVSDLGCICMTDDQVKQFASRGGNKNTY
jgi:hypothetical protein